jgi:hypothetical protein
MSRHGYTDGGFDDDVSRARWIAWRGVIASATRGKRGQQFFRELLAALDAMPEKRLVEGELEADGENCALGVLGKAKGLDLDAVDTYDEQQLGTLFDIAGQLAQEVMYENDEYQEPSIYPPIPDDIKAARRWQHVRDWVAGQIVVTADELLPLEES